MIHKIKYDLKQGEVNLNSNHTSLQFDQKDRVEDIQIGLNKLAPTKSSDSSTSFNSIHSIKTLKIKSININGIADQHRQWNPFHYVVASETGVLCIQET